GDAQRRRASGEVAGRRQRHRAAGHRRGEHDGVGARAGVGVEDRLPQGAGAGVAELGDREQRRCLPLLQPLYAPAPRRPSNPGHRLAPRARYNSFARGYGQIKKPPETGGLRQPGTAYARAARSAFLRSLSFKSALRNRIAPGVTSTYSSSSMYSKASSSVI